MKTTKIALALAVAAGLSGCNGTVDAGIAGQETEAPYGNGGKRLPTVNPDGSITQPDGTTVMPDGTVIDADGNEVTPGGNNNNPAPRCDVGTTFAGFDGLPLNRTRLDELQMLDRSRVKPYSAMAGEYTRALGATPPLLATLGSTLGESPARWYIEPESSAVSVFSLYRASFQGCLTMIGNQAKYTAVPSPATASTECTELATKFWSRSPSQAEVSACVNVATTDSANLQDARRRWAHTCAAVASAAGFLTF